tara:strand:+ start:47398 stop:47850 length:453 start_codon:yes stop_codon:yes gene_type:complete
VVENRRIMHTPTPPKGDQPETWNTTLRAFNTVFENVVFQGYKRVEIKEWIKREMIDTAEILSIERIGISSTDNEEMSLTDILKNLISEKIEFYQDQIANLEKVIQESEIQAQLFGDQNEYTQARKNDIIRYQALKEQMLELQNKEIQILG